MGPDQLWRERSYFDLSCVVKSEVAGQNRLSPLASSHQLHRYTQLDEVLGRLEIGYSRRFATNEPQSSVAILDAFRRSQTTMTWSRQKSAAPSIEFGAPFSRYLQDRTSRESWLKQGKNCQSVLAANPVAFLEARTTEVFIPKDAHAVDLPFNPDLGLYSTYLTKNIRCWIILRRSRDQSCYDAARRLRVYLSRIFCQTQAYRTLITRLARLHAVAVDELREAYLEDFFSKYLASDRRFVTDLCKDLMQDAYPDLGPSAKFAPNELSPADWDDIERSLPKLIPRKNILQNALADMRYDMEHGSGWQVKRDDNQPVVARPAVNVLEAGVLIEELRRLIGIYGHHVGPGRLANLNSRLDEMTYVLDTKDLNGPELLRLLRVFEDAARILQLGSDLVQRSVNSLRALITR